MGAIALIRATLLFFVIAFVACVSFEIAADSAFFHFPSVSSVIPSFPDYFGPRPGAYIVLNGTNIYREEQLQNLIGYDRKDFLVCVIRIKEMTWQDHPTNQKVANIKIGEGSAWVRAEDLAPVPYHQEVCHTTTGVY
jgi:hypothetical protein